ncbi:hypothetical protein [Nitrobacter sp.]|uniref:hypothetical protein n=1 Tax=Nitrobacter sp. TaxID=29420 RepID=UPI003F64DB92
MSIDKIDRAFLQSDPTEIINSLDDPFDFFYGLCSAIDKASAGGKKVTLGPMQARFASAAMIKIATEAQGRA